MVLDAWYLSSIIDKTKLNGPKKPVDAATTRINETFFTTAELNKENYQIPIDKQSVK